MELIDYVYALFLIIYANTISNYLFILSNSLYPSIDLLACPVYCHT